MMQGVTESLAGRAAVVELHSLSVREFEAWSGERVNRARLLEWMFSGGYPELRARGLDPERFYSDYLVTYLERDVRSVLQVHNLRDFDRFMRLCAIRTGQLLSYSSLAADVGVSPNTIKSWISVLQASNVLYLLEPYYQNLGKRIVKTPKLFFLDTGLACHLAGFRDPVDLAHSGLLGPMFETHALGQIVRHHANRGRGTPVYFYRDHYGKEIDFLIPVGDRFHLMECKWAETPSSRVRGFEEFQNLVPADRILSRTLLVRDRGRRRIAGGIMVADTVDLAFLDGPEVL
ncbi:MAG: DUF4143 domain-containing protein [Deltaproteobacteria bacterium]|nr:DUF4143 domain-containing protein [Deltaproteobacteria bacterium]